MNNHPNFLASDKSLLVIVDLQTKLSAAMESVAAELVSKNIVRLIEAANLLDIPIVVTEQYPQGLGVTEEAISRKLFLSTPIFEKSSFSCCGCVGFCLALETSERRQIILVGQEAHVCILQSALDLLHRGHQVFVVEDAVNSRKLEHKQFALQRMQQQGVTMVSYESVLFEWLRTASHPHFKAISNLLR
jgi:nicotinamidase-related amidase